MPKHGFLTPKAISNRIKAKGLGKLKWFCQMCNKQCRDDNGFKCHKLSEAHQRQMTLFIDNPEPFMNAFSEEFLAGYLFVLRHQGGRAVNANEVYKEYIADKQHIHMNATIWDTLSTFVKFLGKKGYAKVESYDDGGKWKKWRIQYIDRDPKTLERQKKVEAMRRQEARMRIKTDKMVVAQIERTQKLLGSSEEPKYSALALERDEKVSFSMGSFSSKKKPAPGLAPPPGLGFEVSNPPGLEADSNLASRPAGITRRTLKGTEPQGSSGIPTDNAQPRGPPQPRNDKPHIPPRQPPVHFNGRAKRKHVNEVFTSRKKKSRRKASTLASLMQEHESAKRTGVLTSGKYGKRDRNINRYEVENWISVGIIVKIWSERLGKRFHNKKGEIIKVENKFTAHVQMLKSKAIIKIDQTQLETVVPAFGRLVLVVNGQWRSREAKLMDLDRDSLIADLLITTPERDKGNRIKVPIANFSKLAPVR